MRVGIKLVHPEAREPRRSTPGSAGYDLYAVEPVRIPPGITAKVRTGISLEIPDGYEAQVRPRSGMWASGVQAGFGTIDSDYRGEVMVSLYCARSTGAMVEVGDRIAQLVFAPVLTVAFEHAQELSETERGSGGHGSTGA